MSNFKLKLSLVGGLSFIIFLIFPALLFAKGYYVSKAGSDSNTGTFSSPFRTIRQGVSYLLPGDTLYVREGTYVETVVITRSGTVTSPIVIMAYPGEEPVIDGQDKLPSRDWGDLVVLRGDYIHMSGFEVKNSNVNGYYLGGGGIVLSGNNNKVSNMNVHHIWEHGIHAKGNSSIVEDCMVWQCAYSNSKRPGSPSAGYWSFGITAARGPNGITRDAVLRRNIVFNNWGEGLSTFEADGTIIEDNIIYDNWSVNLYVSDTRNALVQRNIVYNTPNNLVGQRRPMTLGDEVSSKPRSANNTIINNFLYNVDLWAFWSTVVSGSGLDNVVIAFNTVVNGQLEIGENKNDGVINKSGYIYNNIFMHESQNPWDIKGSLQNLTFQNNLWSLQPPTSIRSQTDIIGDPQLERSGGTGPGELTPDYFVLSGSSPAINKGINLKDVQEDFFENLRDNKPDIGGHEFSVTVGIDDQVKSENVKIWVADSQLYVTAVDQTYTNMVVYSIQGTPVFNRMLNGNEITADISFLPRGIYVVVLTGKDDRKKTQRIIRF